MRFQNQETSEINHSRFVRRAIEQEEVWYLLHPEGGAATSVSMDDRETVVLLFWSDRAHAARAKAESFPNFEETSLDLFEFLFRWLPGMTGDHVLAGTNWTQDLIGLEKDPRELHEEMNNQMPAELRTRYQALYDKLSKEEG